MSHDTCPPVLQGRPNELHRLVVNRTAPDTWDALEPLPRRLLRIESLVYAAAETRGHSAELGGVEIAGQVFTLRVYAMRPRGPLGAPVMGDGRARRRERKAVAPADRAMLVVRMAGWGGARRWTDKPGKPLETQITRLIRHLERLVQDKAAHRARTERREREADVARRKTAYRVFQAEERARRPQVVRSMAAQWQETCWLQAFLDVLEARFDTPPAAIAAWLAAARNDLADRNPLSPARLQMLLFHANAIAQDPEDDAPPHPDETYWFEEGAMRELVDDLFGDVRLPI